MSDAMRALALLTIAISHSSDLFALPDALLLHCFASTPSDVRCRSLSVACPDRHLSTMHHIISTLVILPTCQRACNALVLADTPYAKHGLPMWKR